MEGRLGDRSGGRPTNLVFRHLCHFRSKEGGSKCTFLNILFFISRIGGSILREYREARPFFIPLMSFTIIKKEGIWRFTAFAPASTSTYTFRHGG
ncbi:MAG TPA: hypothetical protein VMV49_14780 [Candidatus Deferrimicrobium sp.]|nr:hypothetical protein [Candidatus Deferrimicrobium sp.]